MARPETVAEKKSRLAKIIECLRAAYPDAHCALIHCNPYELLVATILSAQCTDKRVNMVTPELFRRYPDALALSKATITDLEALIHSTGFYKNKAKNLLGLGKQLLEKHRGEVPQSMAELVVLPGVGRKTANVVLGNAFGKPAGVVVDTHVTRLSRLLKLSRSSSAEKIEMDLGRLTPVDAWVLLPHLLIEHGRQVCIARRPQCQRCVISTHCPSAQPSASC